jgi:hypothetical protein
MFGWKYIPSNPIHSHHTTLYATLQMGLQEDYIKQSLPNVIPPPVIWTLLSMLTTSVHHMVLTYQFECLKDINGKTLVLDKYISMVGACMHCKTRSTKVPTAEAQCDAYILP